MRKIGRLIGSCLAACCVTLSMCAVAITSSAAGYSGSGTLADPFLVTNAEQLQNMRDNLSAHYKLANTIDLSGVNFKTIGRLDAPFTGSFVCEMNADSTPKYVIKNLKMTVAETPYAAEKKNKWEAGLFGAASAATFSGIYVLDSEVINNNVGDNTGAVAYGDFKPGMDEMPTGILCGNAENANFMNCASSGSVSGSANNCGGLVGRLNGGSATNCYSTASVNTKGKWNVGGLIGSIDNASVESCFSTGNVSGGQTNIAGFIGSVGGVSSIKNCYSTGNAESKKEDATNFTVLRQAKGSSITDCYATGAISASVAKSADDGNTVTNCYTLIGKLSDMTGFIAADMATIKGKLGGAAWDNSGAEPKLKGIGIVTDSSAYQPGAVEAPQGTVSQSSGSSEQVTDSASSEQYGSTEVAEMMAALPDPDDETVDLMEHKDEIKKAYYAYEALSTSEKDDFDPELFAKIGNLRSKLSITLAGDVVKRIKALPDVKKLKSSDVKNIMDIYSDYEFLEDSVKKELDEDIVKKLEDARKFALENADSAEVSQELRSWEKVFVVVCCCIIVLSVSFDIFVAVWQIRIMKKHKVDLEDIDDDTDLTKDD